MIARLITAHKPDHDRMVGLHQRYKCSLAGVPIFTRKFLDQTKINAQLNNDFFSDIIDTKVGYFLGIPITYSYMEPEKDPETGEPIATELQTKKMVDQKLSDFVRRENVPEVDAEASKFAAICGYGARLCYIGTDGEEHIENAYPWECIFLVDDNDIQRPEYAVRYWEEATGDKDQKTVIKAEFYDSTTITYFRQDKSADNQPVGLSFSPDPEESPNPRPHMFAECPLLGFPNNNEMQGDCEKVLSLIDAYDRTLSDVNSELEQMRLAYMLIYGVGKIDDEFMEQVKKTGAIGFEAPINEGGGDARFIEKNLNVQAVEAHLDRLCNDIYYFAGSPNFRDQAFAGNISGVALKFKLFKLESKCITAEREITTALRQMFRVIGNKWKIENVDFDPEKVEFDFKRNFPLNLLDDAQTQAAYMGLVSEKTRLSKCAIVKNVEEEMAAMDEEAARLPDLDQALPEDDEETAVPQEGE